MKNLFKNAKTVIYHPQMIAAYSTWSLNQFIGSDPKIKIPYGGSVGHLRHFSEFWSVTNNINKMNLAREQKLVNNVLPQGGCAFDIGANVGVFSIMMAKTCQDISIHAFEPIPATFSILKSNLQDNYLETKIIHNNFAVSNKSGSIRLINRLDSPSQNKIILGEDEQNNSVLIASKTIDDYCHEQNIEFIDFAKIDVEGAELLVLQGAEKMMLNKKISALLIEVIPHAVTDMGFSLEDLVNYIDSVGYKCFKVNEDGTRGKHFSLEDMRKFKLENVLLMPRN